MSLAVATMNTNIGTLNGENKYQHISYAAKNKKHTPYATLVGMILIHL